MKTGDTGRENQQGLIPGADEDRILRLARAALPGADGPSPHVRVRIREMAEAQLRSPWAWVASWRVIEAAAAAAVFLVVGGAWLFTVRNGEAARLHEASALVAIVSEAELEASAGERSLQSLAQQLLEMEGLTFEGDLNGAAEEPTSNGEHLPTTSQGHSSPAFPIQRCG